MITCEQGNINASVVQATCETILEELDVDMTKFEYCLLPSEDGRRTSDIIREYVMEKSDYIDFLFVGNKGADFSSKDVNKYIGSVANEMVRNTRVNLFFMV